MWLNNRYVRAFCTVMVRKKGNAGLMHHANKHNRLGEAHKQLAYVQHSGWANQLVALAHALQVARRSNRSVVVPRALHLGDVLDDGGCLGRPPPTAALLLRYTPFDVDTKRLLLSTFIDVLRWKVPADQKQRADASIAFVENRCANATEVEAEIMPQIWEAEKSNVVQLGSAFTLFAERTCDFCSIKYRQGLRHRAMHVLCTIPGLCSKGANNGKFDAIHLRLQEPYPSQYNVTEVLRTALKANFNSSSPIPRPLYIASDHPSLAMNLSRALNVAGRALISFHNVKQKALLGVFGTGTERDSRYTYFRHLMFDALVCIQAQHFTGSAGTFSGHILGMRACAKRSWSVLNCPAQLLPYDYSANCPTAWTCHLPIDLYS